VFTPVGGLEAAVCHRGVADIDVGCVKRGRAPACLPVAFDPVRLFTAAAAGVRLP
jgi:hypothetical protein